MSYINVDITDHVKNDPDYPLNVDLISLYSDQVPLIGRFFSTTGEGPHPTVLFLHGFPGIQQNTDWPYFLQQRGFHVLTFHYRGTWGSSGDFSFGNCLEDVKSALNYLADPENLKKYRIDPERLSICGHSFGGCLALLASANDQRVTATAALSPFNLGLVGELVKDDVELQQNWVSQLNQIDFLLQGVRGKDLVEEVLAHYKKWQLTDLATAFTQRPLLLTAATKDSKAPMALHYDPLYDALVKSGSTVDVVKIETDHHYLDKRETMAQLLFSWLKKHC